MQLSLNKLPWYGQVGVFAVVSAMAVGAYFYFYDATARAEVAAKRQQLAKLHAEIARGRQLAARLPEFRTQVVDLEARLDSLKAVLPEQKDVGDLLRRIQTLAAQSNLEVRGFKPQPIAQKQMHAEWPIAIELDGTYHDLGAFFDRVSKVPRIINMSSVTIKARGQQGTRAAAQAAEGKTISANCVATTFVLSEPPPEAPAKGAGKGAGKGAKPAAASAAARKP
jgi:type IV pilus assembly protein PilO